MIDYQQMLNERIKQVKPSGIRRFFDIANEMEDVISLSIGEPDFSTPWHVREAGIDSLRKGKTWYTPNRGFMELRREIARYFDRRFHVQYHEESDVLVTVPPVSSTAVSPVPSARVWLRTGRAPRRLSSCLLYTSTKRGEMASSRP